MDAPCGSEAPGCGARRAGSNTRLASKHGGAGERASGVGASARHAELGSATPSNTAPSAAAPPTAAFRAFASPAAALWTAALCAPAALAAPPDARADNTQQPATPPDRRARADAATEAEAASAEAPKPSWDIAFSGYFRAPAMLGLSRRADPGAPDLGRRWQITHAPNRLLDADYNSFAYTRLEEGDWAELYVTAKRPHVAATVAFMGSWYTWAGYPNGDASWVPAQAWVDLDSDVSLGALRPHVELKGGVFWQRWGMFEKYDTYLFGRFHQAGAAFEAQLPLGGFEARLVEGFGTNRNGSASAGTGLTLLHYTHVGLRYQKLIDIGAYHNVSWTRDPTLFFGSGMAPEDAPTTPGPNGEPGGGSFTDARQARVAVYGADINLRVPHVGHAWVGASHVGVTNGWAVPNIVEVMHSPGGSGLAENYLGYGEPGSTGSGTLSNLAWLYETSVRSIEGEPEGTLPDLGLTAFGMLVHARRNLSPDATIARDLDQLKWGSDLTVKIYPWLACMLRYDEVNLDTSGPGHSFHAITPRVTFTSHALSTESIWLQYTRYFYEDEVVLETSATQPYSRPDQHVLKLQANLSF